MIVPAPPGMVALQDIPATEECDGVMLDLEVVCLQPVEPAEGGVPFEAWVVFGGEFRPAGSVPHFAGFGWKPTVVAAVPGAGWKVDDGGGLREVEAWAVRSDGTAVAVVINGQMVAVIDADLREVEFQAPGWRNSK